MHITQDVSAAAVNALQAALAAEFPEAKVSSTGPHLLRVSLALECGRDDPAGPNHDRFDAMLARTRHWHVLWRSFMIKVSMIVTDRRTRQVTYSLQETIEYGRIAA